MSGWPTIEQATNWVGPIDGAASTTADLTVALAASVGWLCEHTVADVTDDEVPAPLLQACRLMTAHLFKRRDAAGGVAGFGDTAIRMYAVDADVHALIGPYLEVLLK